MGKFIVEYSDSYYGEIALISRDYEHDICITVNIELDGRTIPYLRVFNKSNMFDATHVTRFHFKDGNAEFHDTAINKMRWVLTDEDDRNIRSLLERPCDIHVECSNWQYACYSWNWENYLVKSFKDYFAGKYGHMYDNDRRLNSLYVPSTQEMPEKGWVYDPLKGK